MRFELGIAGYWLLVIGYRLLVIDIGGAPEGRQRLAGGGGREAPKGRQKHNDMTTFDKNWEHEEQQGLLQRLRGERGTWAKRRRTQRTVLASVAVLAVAAVPLIDYSMAADKRYDGVVCNRSGIADSHWADVAGHILTVKSYEL